MMGHLSYLLKTITLEVLLSSIIVRVSSADPGLNPVSLASDHSRLMASTGHMEDLRNVIGRMASELDRFNTLYVVKLERELTSTSARLSALESTVRAVADRALAWDNIQNHMAVWTDQSRTMERKLDILNRCHEKQAEWESKLNAVDALNHKLTALDIKINAMTRLEFKVEQVSERVEEVDSKVSWLQKQAQQNAVAKGPSSGGLWAEFAGRGILTTLSSIEQSILDFSKTNTASNNHNYVTTRNRPRIHNARTRTVRHPHEGNKVQCGLQDRDTRLLEDVSAKVDLVFDRLTDPEEDYDNFIAHLSRRSLPQTRSSSGRPTDHKPHVERMVDDRSDDDTATERIFAMFWRSLFAPFKKLNRRFRSLEGHLSQLTRQCMDQSSRGDISPVPTSPPPSVAPERPQVIQPQLSQAQLRMAVSEALAPLRQVVSNNHLKTNEEFSTIVELLKEIGQTVDSSTFRSEEEASKTRELVDQQHRDLTTAITETQKIVKIQCSSSRNQTRLDHRSKVRVEYRPTAKNEVTVPGYPARRINTAAESFLTDSLEKDVEMLNGRRAVTRQNRQSQHSSNEPAARVGHDNEETILPLPQPSLGTEDDTDFERKERFQSLDSETRENVAVERRRIEDVDQINNDTENRIPFHISPRISHRNHFERNRATEPTVVMKIPKTKSSRSMGCNDVSATGIVKLPGSSSPNTEGGSAYYIRYCNQYLPGGGWTVIQRRGTPGDNTPPGTPLNFTRSWDEYREGFGKLDGEFWWGNEFIHRLSQERNLSIRFDLWDFEGNYAVAEYDLFRLGNESTQYPLMVSGYRGNASDSFSAHNTFAFSTYDRDNDRAPECCPCAPAYGGGWWFFSCFESNLNGDYHLEPEDNDYYRGLIWELWKGDYSLKATRMSVRPAPLPALHTLL